MTALPKQKYNLEEYFEIERNSEEKLSAFDAELLLSEVYLDVQFPPILENLFSAGH